MTSLKSIKLSIMTKRNVLQSRNPNSVKNATDTYLTKLQNNKKKLW